MTERSDEILCEVCEKRARNAHNPTRSSLSGSRSWLPERMRCLQSVRGGGRFRWARHLLAPCQE
jgi:hypothetical protein